MRRSSSGFTAFAFASVVWMRSWSMTSRERFIISALRCAGSRLSLPFCFPWRMARPYLCGAQGQPARLERLDDLFDRLATEVGDRVQLGLALLHEIADRLYARPLEAVVGPDAQLELLDE